MQWELFNKLVDIWWNVVSEQAKEEAVGQLLEDLNERPQRKKEDPSEVTKHTTEFNGLVVPYAVPEVDLTEAVKSMSEYAWPFTDACCILGGVPYGTDCGDIDCSECIFCTNYWKTGSGAEEKADNLIAYLKSRGAPVEALEAKKKKETHTYETFKGLSIPNSITVEDLATIAKALKRHYKFPFDDCRCYTNLLMNVNRECGDISCRDCILCTNCQRGNTSAEEKADIFIDFLVKNGVNPDGLGRKEN